LVEDEQAMEHELARYAAICILANKPHFNAPQVTSPIPTITSPTASVTPMPHETGSVVGIEPFDGQAARASFVFVQKGITELGDLGDTSLLNCDCGNSEMEDEDDDDDHEDKDGDVLGGSNYQDLADTFSSLYDDASATDSPLAAGNTAALERRQLWRRQEQQHTPPPPESRVDDNDRPPPPLGLWDDESGTRAPPASYDERSRLIPK
jgi:hypothetical protein